MNGKVEAKGTVTKPRYLHANSPDLSMVPDWSCGAYVNHPGYQEWIRTEVCPIHGNPYGYIDDGAVGTPD